jgi:DNA (cytosine-5)-methyltransferase 1
MGRGNLSDVPRRGKTGQTVEDAVPGRKRDATSAQVLDGTKTGPAVQPIAIHSKPLKVISLFSGCGGMDLGFLGGFEFLGTEYEKLPYHIVWANEIREPAAKTYRHNIGNEIRVGDIWEKIDSMPSEADVIIGGFPCQDISVNGNGAGVKHGTRSGLYRAMVEAVRRVQPKAFVAENVASLLNDNHQDSFKQVLTDFLSLGYNVHHQLYTTSDYGVPQTRERIFFVGTKICGEGVKSFIPPQGNGSKKGITAKEAIGDLEEMRETPEFNHVWSRASVSPEQGNRRLKSDRPGYTIRAECHGNIQWHYKLPRRISMREAARIQSFPDSFVFQSALRETERQVGNAVPPVMAWHIARAVLNCFL